MLSLPHNTSDTQVVRRVTKQHRGMLPPHELSQSGFFKGITTEQAMLAKGPKITRPRNDTVALELGKLVSRFSLSVRKIDGQRADLCWIEPS
jgi:hypothetical protein